MYPQYTTIKASQQWEIGASNAGIALCKENIGL